MLVQKGFTILFTGLPYSGKSTLADMLEGELLERGLKVELLDEKKTAIINALSLKQDYSIVNRDKTTSKFAYISQLLSRNQVITILSSISPTKSVRNELRNQVGDLIEVHLKCSVDVCKSRDELKLFASEDSEVLQALIDSYEEPDKAEVILQTDKEDKDACLKTIIKTLEILEWIPKGYNDDYSEEEEAKIHDRLESLGYL